MGFYYYIPVLPSGLYYYIPVLPSGLYYIVLITIFSKTINSLQDKEGKTTGIGVKLQSTSQSIQFRLLFLGLLYNLYANHLYRAK